MPAVGTRPLILDYQRGVPERERPFRSWLALSIAIICAGSGCAVFFSGLSEIGGGVCWAVALTASLWFLIDR